MANNQHKDKKWLQHKDKKWLLDTYNNLHDECKQFYKKKQINCFIFYLASVFVLGGAVIAVIALCSIHLSVFGIIAGCLFLLAIIVCAIFFLKKDNIIADTIRMCGEKTLSTQMLKSIGLINAERINFVDSIIPIFEGDEKLMTIIRNIDFTDANMLFTLEQNLHNNLLFCLDKTDNFKIDSDFKQWIGLHVGCDFSYFDFSYFCYDIDNLKETYQLLVNQQVIDDFGYNAFYAFLYIVYSVKKEQFYFDAIKRLNLLGIDENLSLKEIANKLIECDVETVIIVSVLMIIDSKKKDFQDWLCLKGDHYVSLVKSLRQDYEERLKIESLLNGNAAEAVYTIADCDMMTGKTFEKLVVSVFNALGYNTQTTKDSGDQGVDVIATKGNIKIAIQTKCYSQAVGNHSVMEVVAGGKYYSTNRAMVITNNYFTKSARELAAANNVVLWDRNILQEKLTMLKLPK